MMSAHRGQSGPCAPSAMIGSRLYLAGQLRRDFPLRSFEDVVEKTGMAVCDLGGRIAFGVAFLRSPSSILHLGTIIAQLWSTVYSCDSICCGPFSKVLAMLLLLFSGAVVAIITTLLFFSLFGGSDSNARR